jgi:hypothetical protein
MSGTGSSSPSGGFYGQSTPSSGGQQAPGGGFYGPQPASPAAPHVPEFPGQPSTSGANDFGVYYLGDNGPAKPQTWGGLTPAGRKY